MRRTVAGLVFAVLVVAALGVGYLGVNSGRQANISTSTSHSASTSTSNVKEPTSTASATSPSGLELRVELNATTMLPGQALAANVGLFNSLDENLSLTTIGPANLTNQIAAWNNDDFVCGIGGVASGVAGFALFRGHVSGDNLSIAPNPLQLAQVTQVPCNSMPLGDSIVFLPHSENVSISQHYPLLDPANLNLTTSCYQGCTRDSGLFGYWDRTSYICCAASANAPNFFRYFTPGEYTIAAEDLWGDRVFAYFQVTQGPSPSLAVAAQESPFSNEGHPIIGITLADFADVPITSLDATLRFVGSSNAPSNSTSYPFTFGVNSSEPLLPGQYAKDIRTLQGNLFDIGVSYPLTVSGTLANGTTFSYTQQVHLVNSVPS